MSLFLFPEALALFVSLFLFSGVFWGFLRSPDLKTCTFCKKKCVPIHLDYLYNLTFVIALIL
jgi:hypothetical protein